MPARRAAFCVTSCVEQRDVTGLLTIRRGGHAASISTPCCTQIYDIEPLPMVRSDGRALQPDAGFAGRPRVPHCPAEHRGRRAPSDCAVQVGELHGRLEAFNDLKRLQEQVAALT